MIDFNNVGTIIWDFDGTVWFHREDEIEKLARKIGITEVKELTTQFYCMINAYNKTFVNDIVTYSKVAKIIEQNMPILQEYGISGIEFLKLWQRYQDIMNCLNEEAKKLIIYFSEKGIEQIGLSDWFYDFQTNNLKRYDLLQYFKKIHACDNSFLKANPKRCSEVVKKGKEEKYLIIGDSIASDITFAENAGIKSVWLNPKKQTSKDKEPTIEVVSLLEIFKYM